MLRRTTATKVTAPGREAAPVPGDEAIAPPVGCLFGDASLFSFIPTLRGVARLGEPGLFGGETLQDRAHLWDAFF